MYLTYWFPRQERARAVAQFMVALPLATVIAGPVSGVILDHVHWFGLQSWRWVFILEGFPAVLFGIATLFILVDGPAKAKWLTAEEKRWLINLLEAEAAETKDQNGKLGFWRSILGGRTLLLAFIYYSKSTAIYVLAYFTPQIVAGLSDHISKSQVGLLTAVPYLLAAICMVLWARRSDRLRERRWHSALPLFLAAAGLCSMPFAEHSIVISLLLLCLVTIGIHAVYGPFWSLPSLFMTGSSAAVGIAAINSLATLGGFVGPTAQGALESATGSVYVGLAVIAAILVTAGVLLLSLPFVRRAEAVERSRHNTATTSPESGDHTVTSGDRDAERSNPKNS